METSIDLKTWLKDNIIQNENGKIYLTDIEKKLKGKFNGKEIGRAMRTVFPGILVKTARNKEYWVKLTRLYSGIQWRSEPTSVCFPETAASAEKTKTQYNTISSRCDIAQSLSNNCSTASTETFSTVLPESKVIEDHTYTVTLVESDHEDMNSVLNTVTTSDILDTINLNLTEKMKALLQSQLQVNKSCHGRRWNPEIIRLCLTLYCRSPKNYEFLSKSGYLILPSARQISRFKNIVDQQAGLNNEVLEWMKNEAMIQKVAKEGLEGGVLIDEMSIQEDLQLKRVGNEYQLIGFVECCEESVYFDKLSGKNDIKLATHVLQLLFIGHTGFRFPVAHFSTTQTSSHELFLIFWHAVKKLSIYGFTVTYLSLDGAQTNRNLMKIFLPPANKTSQSITTMLFTNVFDPTMPKISIIMDYSHLMKKIRNNISKSGHFSYHKKLLKFNNKYIIWDHWLNAYQWDISFNTLKVHHKLTQDHFFLNSQLKMRNHLAEEVLDKNMLHLMQCFQQSLTVQKADELQSSIEVLKKTSVLVEFFRDRRPLKSYDDARLHEIRKVKNWFREWEKQVKESSNENKEKSLLSVQTREDLISCILGFDEMCLEKFKKCNGSIIPARINSDAIENIFSQQRGIHNGANSNRDFLTYCRTSNAIILGEKLISTKSNAGDVHYGANYATCTPAIRKRQPLKLMETCNTQELG